VLGSRSYGRGSVQTIIPLGAGNGALRLTTARMFTPAGRAIEPDGIWPDIEMLQDVPDEAKARAPGTGGATVDGRLKRTGVEQIGSRYIPPDAKDDKALNLAYDLLRGIASNPAFTPNR
jgi:carboxyl-terminal processing protease